MDVTKPERIPSLDVLRGVAAFIVVIGHLFLMYPEAERMQIPTWLRISVLRILVNGHASVILFFVLSGYVLSLPFLHGKTPKYLSYLTKRLCRIYIPFAISILLAGVLYTLSTPLPAEIGSDWFHRQWGGETLTAKNVLAHLAMTGVEEEMRLNGVMWSLVVELRISIIFPVLIYLCKFPRLFFVSALLTYFLTSAIMLLYKMPIQEADSFAESFLITLRFVPFFMAGILLVQYDEKIKSRIIRLNKLQIFMLIIFVLSIFCMPTEIYNHQNISYLSKVISPEMLNSSLKFSADFLLGIASCLLIILAKNYGENIRFFNHKAALWLGKVSYSLYLIHLPLVFVIFRLLLGHMPFFLICLIAVASSLLAAAIFFALIEKPAMKMGRYVSNMIGKK